MNDTPQTVYERQMLTAEKHMAFGCIRNAVDSDAYTKLELYLKGAPIGYIVVLDGFVEDIKKDFDVEIIR